MVGSLDPVGNSSSLTARRSAASNLPGSFELPPPPLINPGAKFQSGFTNNYGNVAVNPSAHSVSSVGNLLTPPNTVPEGVSPASPSGQSTTTSTAPTSAGYSAQSYWGGQSQSSPQYAPYNNSSNQWIPPRGLFPQSASLNSMVRESGTNSPSDGQSVNSQQMYQLPSFGSSLGMSNPTLPTMTSPTSHPLSSGLSPQHNGGVQSGAQPSPTAQEAFGIRQPPTPTYFNQHATTAGPAQGGYHYTSGPSPPVASPLSSSSHHSRMSSHHHSSDLSQLPLNTSHQAAAAAYSRQFGQQYNLPSMGGPVMTNLHSPGGQMSLVGGMSGGMMSGYGAGHGHNMHGMYGMPQQSHHAQPPNDRPFKCDQCMQSFNRNHDLKRHKRIHLAVKPFPCGHCDKSFSRKDALKRHILVKGCGKAPTEERLGSRSSDESSVSPRSKELDLADGEQ